MHRTLDLDTTLTRAEFEQLTSDLLDRCGDLFQQVPDDIKAEVREALADVKKALESNDTDTIKSATEKAAQVSHKMGTAI